MKTIVKKHFVVPANATSISGNLYTPDSDETVSMLVYCGAVNGSGQPTLNISFSDPWQGLQTSNQFVAMPMANGIASYRVAAGTTLSFSTVVNTFDVEVDITVFKIGE
jgi:hypothetical protein